MIIEMPDGSLIRSEHISYIAHDEGNSYIELHFNGAIVGKVFKTPEGAKAFFDLVRTHLLKENVMASPNDSSAQTDKIGRAHV